MMQLQKLIRYDDAAAPRDRAARAVFWSIISAPAVWSGATGWTAESPVVSLLLVVSIFAVLFAWGHWIGLSRDAIVYWETRGYRDDGKEVDA